ncbi:MAG TPA: DUF1153 domain-containing protein [Rhizomicrobium sp.]|jgi:hypothetical protein|nr:DUF1153 domain-containing protein [Rhizomicrobium sp.]
MGRLATDGKTQLKFIYGPAGETLTLPHLPPPETRRWVSRRKAEVVAAVKGGLLTLAEACQRYALSVEEFMSWQQSIERHGLPGLRATQLQKYRHRDTRRSAH